MKILYISKVDISKSNGPGVNEHEFISTLYKLVGKDAHFLIPKPEECLTDVLPIEVITFFSSSKNRKPISWIQQQIDLIKKANSLIKNSDFDMVVLRPEIFDFAYNKILKKNNIPYALKTAGSGKFNVFKRKNILLRSLYSWNQKQYVKLIKEAFLVDVVSDRQRKSVQKITGETQKIICIDNGVDIERFIPADKMGARESLGLKKYNPIIGYAGNFPWKRGAMQMVRALPRLKERYPNIGMVSLGSGRGMNKLYDKAKELKVEENCVFTGQVPFKNVPRYINSFDIGISQLYEEEQGASEQKVRQYIACGKPLIVSPGGTNGFVEENKFGYIVDPNDEDEFYNAVANLLSLETKEYNKLSERERVYAETNLSYKFMVQKRISLYRNMLNI